MRKNLKWNIIIIGDVDVGKTSMMKRYVNNTFTNNKPDNEDFLIKEIKIEGKTVKIVVHDTIGQEKYKSVFTSNHQKADGCILMYDVTSQMTFKSLQSWFTEFRHYNDTAPIIIVGNKDDESKKVQIGQALQFAKEHKISACIETSAKTSKNVEEAFNLLIEEMKKTHVPKYQKDSANGKSNSTKSFSESTIEVSDTDTNSKKKGDKCCCIL